VVTLAAGSGFAGATSTIAETGEVDPETMLAGAVVGGVTGPIGAGGPAKVGGGRVGRTLFHGSDAASVEAVLEHGLDREAARALGGGDIFWTTHELEVARIFAVTNPAGGSPAVLGIHVSSEALEHMVRTGVVKVDRTGALMVHDWDAFQAAARFFRQE
jgi:hypothetical protein